MYRDPISGKVSLPGESPRVYTVTETIDYPEMRECTIRTKHAIGGLAREVLPTHVAVAKKRKLKNKIKILRIVSKAGTGRRILEQIARLQFDGEALRVVRKPSYGDAKPPLTAESVARIKSITARRIKRKLYAPAVSRSRFYAEAYRHFVENFNPSDHRKVRCDCQRKTKKVKTSATAKPVIKVPVTQPRECRKCGGSGYRAPRISEVWNPRASYTVLDELANADRALKRRLYEAARRKKRTGPTSERKAKRDDKGRRDRKRGVRQSTGVRKRKRRKDTTRDNRQPQQPGNALPEYQPEPPPLVRGK